MSRVSVKRLSHAGINGAAITVAALLLSGVASAQ